MVFICQKATHWRILLCHYHCLKNHFLDGDTYYGGKKKQTKGKQKARFKSDANFRRVRKTSLRRGELNGKKIKKLSRQKVVNSGTGRGLAPGGIRVGQISEQTGSDRRD